MVPPVSCVWFDLMRGHYLDSSQFTMTLFTTVEGEIVKLGIGMVPAGYGRVQGHLIGFLLSGLGQQLQNKFKKVNRYAYLQESQPIRIFNIIYFLQQLLVLTY